MSEERQGLQTGSTGPEGQTVDGLPLVAGEMMLRTLADFERACLVLLRDEQDLPNPDTALIGVLCDSVRLKREYCSWVKAGVTRDPIAIIEEFKAEYVARADAHSGHVKALQEELKAAKDENVALAARIEQERERADRAEAELGKLEDLLARYAEEVHLVFNPDHCVQCDVGLAGTRVRMARRSAAQEPPR